jgi:K+-transporting ATPase ATPase C chain
MLQMKRSFLVFAGLSLICGLIYPLIITVISQIIFFPESNANVIKKGNIIIGSQQIGQLFTSQKYFHGRPSAADPPYDASNSGGSNLAPSSAKLLGQVKTRIEQVRRENKLPANTPIPADLVLASASGLDPHISPEAALLQVLRIAQERKITLLDIEKMIHQNTQHPFLGIWGKERVHVLNLNIALDNFKTQQ